MKKLLLLFVFIISCSSNFPIIKDQSDVEYAVEMTYDENSMEDKGHIVIKLSDSKFNISYNNVLHYDVTTDLCAFVLEYEKDDEIQYIYFINELCDTMVDSFCVSKDNFSDMECNPIGELPESMSGELNIIKNEIFKNEDVQGILSCFRSVTLFNDDVDVSECEKGVF